jgi:predicted pyridoxine 5'-phosphate oxidase superfamily flavin-nucleotide-binding protein
VPGARGAKWGIHGLPSTNGPAAISWSQAPTRSPSSQRATRSTWPTVSESGWPYVQHCGGPPGFLAVLDAHTLAFADLRGNRQLVSVGNLATNDRVALILMDYPNRARLKLLAQAELVAADADPALTARLALEGKTKTVERVVRLHFVGFDWNCPQNITPRYKQTEVEAYVASLGLRAP